MNVLVTVASRHESTVEIAEAIADELRARGMDARFLRIQNVGDLSGFDAVVLGSAVYAGNWMKEARQFVEEHQESLASLPVWLFSSGPIGADDPKPHGDPNQVSSLMEITRARGHQVFAGKLDRSELGLGERLVVRMVRAPEGDFRDWDAIRAWADEIATSLEVISG